MERFTLSNGVTAVKGIDKNGQVRIVEERDGKYFELSPSEYEEAIRKSSSVLGSIKEGIKQSYHEHMATANKLLDNVTKGTQEANDNDSELQAINKQLYGDDYKERLNKQRGEKSKSRQDKIEYHNDKAKTAKENTYTHGHENIGAFANVMASPTNLIPQSFAGKGAWALGKAVLGSGALASGDQLLRDYGNTYKTEEEKAEDLVKSAIFGGLGGGALYGVLRGLSKGRDILKNRKANKTDEVQENITPTADEITTSDNIEISSQQNQPQPQPQSRTLDDYTSSQADGDMADNIRNYLSDDTTTTVDSAINDNWRNNYIDEVNTEQQIDDAINNAWANDTELKKERANLLGTLNKGARAKRQAELEEVFKNSNDDVLRQNPVDNIIDSNVSELDNSIDIQLSKYNDEFNDRLKNAKGYHYKIKEQVKNNNIKNPKAEELKNKIQSEMTEQPYIDYNGVRYDIFTKEPISETVENVLPINNQVDNTITSSVQNEMTEPLTTSNVVDDIVNPSDDVVTAPVETLDTLNELAEQKAIADDVLNNTEIGVKEIDLNNGSIRFNGALSSKVKNELKEKGFVYNNSTKSYENIDPNKAEEYLKTLITKNENVKENRFSSMLISTGDRFNLNFAKAIRKNKSLSKADISYLEGKVSSIPQKNAIIVNSNLIKTSQIGKELYYHYKDKDIYSIRKLANGKSKIVLVDENRIDELEALRDKIENELHAKNIGTFEYGGIVYDEMGMPRETLTAKEIAKENGIKNVDDLFKKYEEGNLNLSRHNQVEDIIYKARERIDLNNSVVRTLKDTENSIDEVINSLANKGSKPTARGIVGGLSGIGYEAYEANEEDRDFNFNNALANALIGFGGGVQGGGMIVKAVNNSTKKTNGKQFIKSIRSKLNDVYKSDLGNLLFNSRLAEKKDYLKLRDDWQSSQDKMDSKLSIIYKALNEHLSVQDKKDLHNLLVGEEVDNASNTVVRLAKDFRTEINKLSNELVDLGILSKETNEEWGEIYLHRSYERSIDKGLKRLFNGAKAIHPIHQRGKKWVGSADEYQKYLDNGAIGRISEGKITAELLDNGKYEFRQDWSKAEREAMGEITDGSYTVVETLKHLYDMRNAGRLLKNIKEQTNYMSKNNMGDDILLSGRKWGAMQGLYVPREIATDLKNQYNQIFGHEDTFKRLWSKYLSAIKKAWVVYNPTSHLNNVMSNVAFMVTSGVSPLKAFSETLKSLNTVRKIENLNELRAKKIANQMTEEDNLQFNKLMNDDGVKWYLEAEDVGVFGGSKLQEMLTQRGIAKQETKNPIRKGYNKVNETFEKMYQAEDDMGRLAFYKILRTNGVSKEDAVKEIRNIIPDYRRPMSWFFSKGRDTGLLPFVSWTYHVFPTIMKQLYKPIVNPFSKTNYGTGIWKSQAISSLVGIGGLFGLAQILALGTGAPSHIKGEEAPKNWDRRFMFKVDDNVYGIKYDRWLPHFDFSPQNIGSTARNYLTGGIPQKLLEPFINNNMYYGTPITYNKGSEGFMDKAVHFARNTIPIPKWVLNIGETGKSIVFPQEDDPRKYYRNRNVWEDLLGSLGVNVRHYEQDKWVKELENRKRKEEGKKKKERREGL